MKNQLFYQHEPFLLVNRQAQVAAAAEGACLRIRQKRRHKAKLHIGLQPDGEQKVKQQIDKSEIKLGFAVLVFRIDQHIVIEQTLKAHIPEADLALNAAQLLLHISLQSFAGISDVDEVLPCLRKRLAAVDGVDRQLQPGDIWRNGVCVCVLAHMPQQRLKNAGVIGGMCRCGRIFFQIAAQLSRCFTVLVFEILDECIGGAEAVIQCDPGDGLGGADKLAVGAAETDRGQIIGKGRTDHAVKIAGQIVGGDEIRLRNGVDRKIAAEILVDVGKNALQLTGVLLAQKRIMYSMLTGKMPRKKVDQRIDLAENIGGVILMTFIDCTEQIRVDPADGGKILLLLGTAAGGITVECMRIGGTEHTADDGERDTHFQNLTVFGQQDTVQLKGIHHQKIFGGQRVIVLFHMDMRSAGEYIEDFNALIPAHGVRTGFICDKQDSIASVLIAKCQHDGYPFSSFLKAIPHNEARTICLNT